MLVMVLTRFWKMFLILSTEVFLFLILFLGSATSSAGRGERSLPSREEGPGCCRWLSGREVDAAEPDIERVLRGRWQSESEAERAGPGRRRGLRRNIDWLRKAVLRSLLEPLLPRERLPSPVSDRERQEREPGAPPPSPAISHCRTPHKLSFVAACPAYCLISPHGCSAFTSTFPRKGNISVGNNFGFKDYTVLWIK